MSRVKEYTVKSKYKNPDRYIRELKRNHDAQFNSLVTRVNYWQDRVGVACVTYNKTSESDLSVNDSSLTKFAVNDKIVIEAVIKSVKGDRLRADVTFDQMLVRKAK